MTREFSCRKASSPVGSSLFQLPWKLYEVVVGVLARQPARPPDLVARRRVSQSAAL